MKNVLMAEHEAADVEEPAQVPAVVDNALPAELAGLEGFTGYETMDASKFVIPRAKIIQPTSDLGTPGTIIMLLTGEEMPELDLLVIKTEPGRSLWEKDNFEAPICRSHDGKVPDPKIEEPQCAQCTREVTIGGRTINEVVCPMAQWGDDGERPACGEQINVLAMTLPEGMPFWISLGGNNLKPIRKYISAIGLRGKPLFLFKANVQVVEKTNPKRHFVLDFGKPCDLNPADLIPFKDIVLRVKDETMANSLEAEEAAKSAAEGAEDAESKPKGTAKKPDWMARGKSKGKAAKADKTEG